METMAEIPAFDLDARIIVVRARDDGHYDVLRWQVWDMPPLWAQLRTISPETVEGMTRNGVRLVRIDGKGAAGRNARKPRKR